jgi:PhzF family phenazine biosynthesis protein
MTVQLYIIDAFASEKFKGNPTAVCITETELPSATMHSIAKELNFPVTAFVTEGSAVDGNPIRYFTITGEIPACGHATLASSSVFLGKNDHARFKTIENILIDVRLDNGIIYMTYPKYELVDFDIKDDLLKSLGLENYRSAGLCRQLETLFIEIDDPALLRKIAPDHKALVKSDSSIIEVVVTSVADDKQYDFLLRSFCPWIGIDEDPVTGSVHSVLAHYWKERTGKAELKAYQASERGGDVRVRALDNKVELGGKAVLIGKGELFI